MPFKYKEDYNANRRKYRKRKLEEGCCHRCYRPMMEDAMRSVCECCMETIVRNDFLRRNFNGDN